MAKPRRRSATEHGTQAARPQPQERPLLGAGLHAGRIELVADRAYRVRTADGRRLAAVLSEEVSPSLAEECLRDGRTVLLVDGARGPTIVGALQVAPTIAPDASGTLSLDARTLRLRASSGLSIEVGDAVVGVEPNGVVRMEGDRLLIDMAQIVRIFSGRVDLP
jgi:hypothetical protein